MKSIIDVNFAGRKVIVRVDFNVPLNDKSEITDDTRMRESLPTIKKLMKDGAAIILLSHLGRPKGEVRPEFSMRVILSKLKKMLDTDIIFIPEMLTEKVFDAAKNLKAGEILLLENLRFTKKETTGDKVMAMKLASMGDAYIFDAFGTAHRKHTSICFIAKYFPNDKYFGLLMEHEIVNLERAMKTNERPYTAVIGGAKVSTKIDIIRNLIPKVDNMIIGGGMSFTFLKALGGDIGNSLYEEDKLEMAKAILDEIILAGVNIYLPLDVVIADDFNNNANIKLVDANKIPDGWMGLDIGPRSRQKFAEAIIASSVILWNGPMGVFEMENFSQGTKSIAIAVAAASVSGAFTAVGGGDSVAAINKYKLGDLLSYVSTGGGAMLEYIEGKELPGIQAILAK